jgi:Tol biopolymer transport system component
MSDRNSRASTDIYTMSAQDGSDVRRITNDLANWAPQYSPDGSALAIQVDYDIVTVDLASGRRRRLTFEPNTGMNPTWSPDGSRLAFVTRRRGPAEIFSMKSDGSEQKVLVSMRGGDAFDPRWSRVGDRIAFVFLSRGDPNDQPDPQASQAIYTLDVASGRISRVSR